MSSKSQLIILLCFVLFMTSILILPSQLSTDRPTETIYMAEGTEFLEIDVENWEVNRTIDLGGTSVDFYYDERSDKLYGTVGAVNKLHRINTSTFTIEDTFAGHTFNVHDARVNHEDNELYSASSDATLRKLDLETMEQEDIIEYDHSTLEIEYYEETNTIFPFTSEYALYKVNAEEFNNTEKVTGFPQECRKGTINKQDKEIYCTAAKGTIYALEFSDFEKYNTFDELPSSKYNSLGLNTTYESLNRSEQIAVDNALIHADYSSVRDKIYTGGSSGLLYEVDPDTLEVERTYNISKNREIEYNYEKYRDFSSIKDGEHIYEDDLRGVSVGADHEYLYITTAPGALIEIDLETFEEVRRINTSPGTRTVHLETVG